MNLIKLKNNVMKNQKLISRNVIRRFGPGGKSEGEPIYNP